MKRYNPTFTIYKPNGYDYVKGCACTWEYAPLREGGGGTSGNLGFLIMAKQKKDKNSNGNFSFDWDNSERFALSEIDLSSIGALLSGRITCLGPKDDKNPLGKGLYHQTSKGNAILKMYKMSEKGFALGLSTRKGSKEFKASMLISEPEAFRILNIINYSLSRMFQDSNVKT